ncbi:alcohol dehydrogenase groES-like domain-containing protein [Hirsutella rhossiliensis]|uniref:alcohol dehydrogenase (NADP(+)) n=1 Tax=Hirsutella rhossiliensis TaxID=111463 RepID=A0A9P8N3W8_9HYPO|nr:alcohol dehydrogenase groES-like domain-containing protein [Hirsutella rhossiliensis]KAH0966354.1 alcohol dehydrogenase groES-like domain-containing protein [Hirsutella rhossiliensis]
MVTTEYKFEGWMGLDPSSVEGNMVWREFEPKPWEETDVDIKITHSGICGSDLSTLRSGWREAPYPVVVGHEIVGVAVRVGSKAEGGIKVGDMVGVGAQSDSCLGRDGPCEACGNECENYCSQVVMTYASKHRNGAPTLGGYGRYHRCPSHFVIKIPDGVAPEHAAPMLCAGVTVYSPLKHFGVGPGKRIAVIGIGGLGHFAVLFAKALGADEVVGISRKQNKRKDAIDLGCDDYIALDDEEGWATKHKNRFDLILSTVSSTKMPLGDYIRLLKFEGTFVQVGLPEGPVSLALGSVMGGRRTLTGSAIGSPREIYEMFKLAAEKNVQPWIEKRPMQDANQAIVDMDAGKPRFRYVLVNN